jgi:hypothetical protein
MEGKNGEEEWVARVEDQKGVGGGNGPEIGREMNVCCLF